MRKPHPDSQLIQNLGGPAALARLLGYQTKGGTQRVSNWSRRGIPDGIKFRNPAIFLAAQKPTPAAKPPRQRAAQPVGV